MSKLFTRIRDLIRPSSGSKDQNMTPGEAARTMTVDLSIAALGFAFFGASISPRGDILWHLFVGAKLSGAFLAAFLLSLAPLYALKRFFDVETSFASIVSAFARLLALAGVFAASSAGFFWLLRHHDPGFDGPLAIVFVGLIAVAALIVRQSTVRLPAFPRFLASVLFLSLLAQSSWAFRPYLDPKGPTLFEAKAEWFSGAERQAMESAILRLGEGQ